MIKEVNSQVLVGGRWMDAHCDGQVRGDLMRLDVAGLTVWTEEVNIRFFTPLVPTKPVDARFEVAICHLRALAVVMASPMSVPQCIAVAEQMHDECIAQLMQLGCTKGGAEHCLVDAACALRFGR